MGRDARIATLARHLHHAAIPLRAEQIATHPPHLVADDHHQDPYPVARQEEVREGEVRATQPVRHLDTPQGGTAQAMEIGTRHRAGVEAQAMMEEGELRSRRSRIRSRKQEVVEVKGEPKPKTFSEPVPDCRSIEDI